MHPSFLFSTKESIKKGEDLKDLYSIKILILYKQNFNLTEDQYSFLFKEYSKNIDSLTFKERARFIANIIYSFIQDKDIYNIILNSFGPIKKLKLGAFFYLVHSFLIERYSDYNFEQSLTLMTELTKRFTSEFCVRKLLKNHEFLVLNYFLKLLNDENEDVRRWISEGSRPLLPWGGKFLCSDPLFTLKFLEKLKYDNSFYVRKSVANHLADLLKLYPDKIYAVMEFWLIDCEKNKNKEKEIKWIIRYAIRLPRKKKEKKALDLTTRAKITKT